MDEVRLWQDVVAAFPVVEISRFQPGAARATTGDLMTLPSSASMLPLTSSTIELLREALVTSYFRGPESYSDYIQPLLAAWRHELPNLHSIYVPACYRFLADSDLLVTLSSPQRRAIAGFCMSAVERLACSNALSNESMITSSPAWIADLNSLAVIFDGIDELLNSLWKCDTVESTRAVLQYLALLMHDSSGYLYKDSARTQDLGKPERWLFSHRIDGHWWTIRESNIGAYAKVLSVSSIKEVCRRIIKRFPRTDISQVARAALKLSQDEEANVDEKCSLALIGLRGDWFGEDVGWEEMRRSL
jgi:hypothetical protein